MPHHGEYEHVKEWLQDHDTDLIAEVPPVQNTWYEAFHAQDVRLLYCIVYQVNDEAAAKDVEIRWTIDGNVYFDSISLPSATDYWIFRDKFASTGGTAGLAAQVAVGVGALLTDKRGLDFQVEARMTSVPGTNQGLYMWCIRETLEVT